MRGRHLAVTRCIAGQYIGSARAPFPPMKTVMSLRVIITAALAALLCGTAGAARQAQPLDVELAIDTTNTMGPSIHRI
jgi:hypothetical protein